MDTEFEATFTDIDKDLMRRKLKEAGARLIKPEFLMRRVVFKLPEGHEIRGGWLRVRDEGDRITMSLKVINGNKIEDQKEICLEVDNFEQAILFLESTGCRKKAFQESKREAWKLDAVEITLDEWPFLEPFVEVEGPDEASVKSTSEKLSFNYEKAIFCSADKLYSLKYGLPPHVINNTPGLIFGGINPFINVK